MPKTREQVLSQPAPALTRVYAWFSAIVADDLSLMEDLYTHGLPVDVPHPLRHTTALMEATRLGRTTLVPWLLSRGAAPTFLCGLPRGTPLHCALKRHHWDIADELCEAAGHCGVTDHYSRTPLHALAMDMPEDPAGIHRALRLAECMLRKAVPPDALDHEGITALHYCIINDMAPLAHLLLQHGANANVITPDTHVSPLIIAALEKNTTLARLLLQFGANPSQPTKDGSTAFSIMPSLKRLTIDLEPLEEATPGKQASHSGTRMVN